MGFGTAAILAGGRSTRMGFDKRLLMAGETSMLESIRQRLAPRFSQILIVTADGTSLEPVAENVRYVTDRFTGYGPLAGLHAALLSAQSEYVFLTACDMPWVDLIYVDYLIKRLQGEAWDACVTLTQGGGIEPFHAFYHKGLSPLIEAHLRAGQRSFYGLLKGAKTRFIPACEALRFTPDWKLFENINTPATYRRFVAQYESKS